MDKRFDDKVSLYQETLENTIKQKTVNVTTDANNTINSVKQVMGSFKTDIQKRLDEYTTNPSQSTNNLEDKIQVMDMKIKSIDISEIKNDLTKISEENSVKFMKTNQIMQGVQNELSNQHHILKNLSNTTIINKSFSDPGHITDYSMYDFHTVQNNSRPENKHVNNPDIGRSTDINRSLINKSTDAITELIMCMD